MSYKLIVSPLAQKHINDHIRSGQKIIVKKIDVLIAEVAENPRSGTGKPEQLRHYTSEVWSRRIDSKHRLIYQIIEDELIVIAISASGHYVEK